MLPVSNRFFAALYGVVNTAIIYCVRQIMPGAILYVRLLEINK